MFNLSRVRKCNCVFKFYIKHDISVIEYRHSENGNSCKKHLNVWNTGREMSYEELFTSCNHSLEFEIFGLGELSKLNSH